MESLMNGKENPSPSARYKRGGKLISVLSPQKNGSSNLNIQNKNAGVIQGGNSRSRGSDFTTAFNISKSPNDSMDDFMRFDKSSDGILDSRNRRETQDPAMLEELLKELNDSESGVQSFTSKKSNLPEYNRSCPQSTGSKDSILSSSSSDSTVTSSDQRRLTVHTASPGDLSNLSEDIDKIDSRKQNDDRRCTIDAADMEELMKELNSTNSSLISHNKDSKGRPSISEGVSPVSSITCSELSRSNSAHSSRKRSHRKSIAVESPTYAFEETPKEIAQTRVLKSVEASIQPSLRRLSTNLSESPTCYNRRETAEFDISDLEVDVGDHSSYKKPSDKSFNRRQTADFADMQNLLNYLEEEVIDEGTNKHRRNQEKNGKKERIRRDSHGRLSSLSITSMSSSSSNTSLNTVDLQMSVANVLRELENESQPAHVTKKAAAISRQSAFSPVGNPSTLQAKITSANSPSKSSRHFESMSGAPRVAVTSTNFSVPLPCESHTVSLNSDEPFQEFMEDAVLSSPPVICGAVSAIKGTISTGSREVSSILSSFSVISNGSRRSPRSGRRSPSCRLCVPGNTPGDRSNGSCTNLSRDLESATDERSAPLKEIHNDAREGNDDDEENISMSSPNPSIAETADLADLDSLLNSLDESTCESIATIDVISDVHALLQQEEAEAACRSAVQESTSNNSGGRVIKSAARRMSKSKSPLGKVVPVAPRRRSLRLVDPTQADENTLPEKVKTAPLSTGKSPRGKKMKKGESFAAPCMDAQSKKSNIPADSNDGQSVQKSKKGGDKVAATVQQSQPSSSSSSTAASAPMSIASPQSTHVAAKPRSCLRPVKNIGEGDEGGSATSSWAPPPTRKTVEWGSPNAAEFNFSSPTNRLTPMHPTHAKARFPVTPLPSAAGDASHANNQEEGEDEDVETAENSRILAEWDRLTNASDLSDNEDEIEFKVANGQDQGRRRSSGSSSKKERRRSSSGGSRGTDEDGLSAFVPVSLGGSLGSTDPKLRRRRKSMLQPTVGPDEDFVPEAVDTSSVDQDYDQDQCNDSYLSGDSESCTVQLPNNIADLLSEIQVNPGDKHSAQTQNLSQLSAVSAASRTEQLEPNLRCLMNSVLGTAPAATAASGKVYSSSPEGLDVSSELEISKSSAAASEQSLGTILGESYVLPLLGDMQGTNTSDSVMSADASHGPLASILGIIPLSADLSVSNISITGGLTVELESDLGALIALAGRTNTASTSMPQLPQGDKAFAAFDCNDSIEDGATQPLEVDMEALMKGLHEGQTTAMPMQSHKQQMSTGLIEDNYNISMVDQSSLHDSNRRQSNDTSNASELADGLGPLLRDANAVHVAHGVQGILSTIETLTGTEAADDMSTCSYDAYANTFDNISNSGNGKVCNAGGDMDLSLIDSAVVKPVPRAAAVSTVQTTVGDSMLQRLKSLNAGARQDSLVQCSTPLGSRSTRRGSFATGKRQSLGPHSSSATKSVLPKRQRGEIDCSNGIPTSTTTSGPLPVTAFSTAVVPLVSAVDISSHAVAIQVSEPQRIHVSEPQQVSLEEIRELTSRALEPNDLQVGGFSATINQMLQDCPEHLREALLKIASSVFRGTGQELQEAMQRMTRKESAQWQKMPAASHSFLVQARSGQHPQYTETLAMILDTAAEHARSVWCKWELHLTDLVRQALSAHIEAAKAEKDAILASTKATQYGYPVGNMAARDHIKALRARISALRIQKHEKEDEIFTLANDITVLRGVPADVAVARIAEVDGLGLGGPSLSSTSALLSGPTTTTATVTDASTTEVSKAVPRVKSVDEKKVEKENELKAHTATMVETLNRLQYVRLLAYERDCIAMEAFLTPRITVHLEFKLASIVPEYSSESVVQNGEIAVTNVVVELIKKGFAAAEPLDSRSMLAMSYFASIMCGEEAGGPLSGRVLETINCTQDIPMVLLKITNYISCLRRHIALLESYFSSTPTHPSGQKGISAPDTTGDWAWGVSGQGNVILTFRPASPTLSRAGGVGGPVKRRSFSGGKAVASIPLSAYQLTIPLQVLLSGELTALPDSCLKSLSGKELPGYNSQLLQLLRRELLQHGAGHKLDGRRVDGSSVFNPFPYCSVKAAMGKCALQQNHECSF